MDLIETLLGIEPSSPLATLRLEREAIRQHTQGVYRELVVPEMPGGVTLAERAGLAMRVAAQAGDAALAGHYAGLLDRVASDAEAAVAKAGLVAGEGRLATLLRYGDQVAADPAGVSQATIDGLVALGFSPQDIVAVTQLAAFVPFQVRLLAGLRALQGKADAGGAVEVRPSAARFTMAEVGWVPRIPPVDAATATPAQLAALEACPPAVRRSIYFLTLAQDPASLGERGALFNSVMYAPRGLPRAERELATATVSMVNGCVYCTSVHARRFAELTKEQATMQRLLEEGFGVALDARRQAIVGFSAKLTARPDAVSAADVAGLRDAGLAELELLDLVHAVAMFANANRLMQALGESVPPRQG